MKTLSFNKEAGSQLFGKINNAAPEKESLKASELLNFVKGLGLTYKNIKITTSEDTVTLEGEVAEQADAEKIALAVGNVSGVEAVNNKMKVTEATPESDFYTVVSGDSLSKIAGKFYGDVQKYPVIFEANKPMLTDPNKIYPGQVLRIPKM
ncbi:peptidoglycan-binding protein LysM [Flavobacterium rhizosphaerae]|uniref:Peptidoglycan-binding protein LysM n=1 Tax=Flavobacterium rhizosphaerae TaxID=3163298 RepID=A0ABW8Z0G0_9FLAO